MFGITAGYDGIRQFDHLLKNDYSITTVSKQDIIQIDELKQRIKSPKIWADEICIKKLCIVYEINVIILMMTL